MFKYLRVSCNSTSYGTGSILVITSANPKLLSGRFRTTVARESTISRFSTVAVCSTTRVERILCRNVWNLRAHVSQPRYEALHVGAYCKSPNCNCGCFVCGHFSGTPLLSIVERGSPRHSLSVRRSGHQRLCVICSTDTLLKGKKYPPNMKTKYVIPDQKQTLASATRVQRVPKH